MDIWSSIRDFYRRWKREIHLYGTGFLLFSSALITNRLIAGLIILVLTLLIDAMHRWGEEFRMRGESVMEERKKRNRELIGDLAAKWLTPTPAQEEAPPHLPATTRVIPRPALAEEDLPESPSHIREPEKPAPVVMPPVTHDT
ncbi:hypothetical protein SAMN02745166_04198 [Prosthecobacter debontii]|uniref:Uncharacterized protein n=1 Tax=Prosthecobacter debontii TaxID=48467 RepID=A0A1T4YTR7_9BACT|nr:hypothetical protein [Prosthecobacter debontii]SKB05189.1 hypothetical protein SAMN02745166_04198 [Prosthecobacter debontii]